MVVATTRVDAVREGAWCSREGARGGLVRVLPVVGPVISVFMVATSSAWAARVGWLAERPMSGVRVWDPAAPVRVTAV